MLDLKIPPLAIWLPDTTTITMENVPPGTYDVYFGSAPNYGELFLDPALTGPNTVTVTTGSSTATGF